MSGDTVIWIAGLICTALYLYALTLPPDKPKRCSDCPNVGTGKKNTDAV